MYGYNTMVYIVIIFPGAGAFLFVRFCATRLCQKTSVHPVVVALSVKKSSPSLDGR